MVELEDETIKMLSKIEPLVETLQIIDTRGNAMKTNMEAYISDSKHFLKTKDLIRAFECAVWAWAILELCEELGIFRIGK
jgi:uncharacterized protein